MSKDKKTEENEIVEESDEQETADEEIPEDRDVDAGEVSLVETCEKLKAEVEKLSAEVADRHDKYLRALADCENYKKRTLKERSELLKYQGEKVFLDLVDVLDDFERAMEHVDAEPGQFKSGIELIYKNFLGVMDKWGVKGESAVGTQFDPTKQNALSKIPVPDKPAGTVISELKKAYFYKDKLLRAGAVVVADSLPEAKPEEATLPQADLSELQKESQEEE